MRIVISKIVLLCLIISMKSYGQQTLAYPEMNNELSSIKLFNCSKHGIITPISETKIQSRELNSLLIELSIQDSSLNSTLDKKVIYLIIEREGKSINLSENIGEEIIIEGDKWESYSSGVYKLNGGIAFRVDPLKRNWVPGDYIISFINNGRIVRRITLSIK